MMRDRMDFKHFLGMPCEWVQRPANDRVFLVRAMQAVADSTFFGVLCVIDGVRAIETQSPKSEFTVTAARDGLVSVVSPSDEFLHDLYRSQAWPGA
jgi:hypothetical protein